VNYAAKNLGSYRRQSTSLARIIARRVRVLDLDPMRRPASSVDAIAMLGVRDVAKFGCERDPDHASDDVSYPLKWNECDRPSPD
jgi:hypothetical protein